MRWWIVLAGFLVAPSPLPAQQAPPTAAAYAVFALESATLGPGARVDAGNVGANRGTVRLAPGVRVAGSVAANTIRLAPRVRASALFCRLVIGPRRFACGGLFVPVVDVGTLPLVQVVPGALDVRVPARAAATPLPAGAYGHARVGTRGTLVLAGGDYAFRSLALAPTARLLCAAPCRLRVEDGVVVGARAILAPAAPLDATAVRLDVEAGARRTGFVARTRAVVGAGVYAPQSGVVIGSRARVAGALLGRTVVVGAGARVTAASGQ